jgi:hypothetical protein
MTDSLTLPSEPTTSRPIASLAEVLAYECPWVASKFRERYAVSEAEGDEIFTETKRWLWLAAYAMRTPSAPTPLTVIGLQEMTVVDEMWHTFMLFSEPYAQFCARYFGWFLHHLPTTDADRERLLSERRQDPERFESARIAEFRAQARFVGEMLGVDTVRKWYGDFGKRYAPAELDRLWRPRAHAESFGS